MSNGTVIDGEKKLREAIAEDPESVKKLFSLVEVSSDNKPVYVGIAARLNQELTSMTTLGGLLPSADQQLQTKVDQFNESATRMQELLDMKESRLYAQFQAMESALADIQSQQTSLNTLSQLASSMSA
jgi:flagellar hook-associated protein 2